MRKIPEGKRFKPGQSGNPSGRSKVIAEIRDLARQHTAGAINTLIAVMQTGESGAARVSAANALLDRGYGRPVQGAPVVLDHVRGTLTERGDAILNAMAQGRLTPSETANLLSALASQAKLTEVDELERRIAALEDRHGKS